MSHNHKKYVPTILYSLIQGLFWSVYACVQAFSSVFLFARGFSSRQVGYVIAAGGLLSALCQPLIGGYADRSRRPVLHRLILLLTAALAAAAVVLLIPGIPFFAAALLYGTLTFFLQSLTPLIYSIGMYYIGKGVPVNFGIARGIGSLAYAVVSVVLGNLVEGYTVNAVMLSAIVLAAGLAVSTVRFHFPSVDAAPALHAAESDAANVLCVTGKGSAAVSHAAGEKAVRINGSEEMGPACSNGSEEMGPACSNGSEEMGSACSNVTDKIESDYRSTAEKTDSVYSDVTDETEAGRADASEGSGSSLLTFLRGNRRFLFVLLGTAALYISHNTIANYMYQIVSYRGYTSVEMGYAIAIAAVAELPALFLYNQLNRRFPSGKLLKFSGIFFFLKCFLLLFAARIGGIYAALLLQCPGYAVFTGASVYYVSHTVPKKDQVRGQSLMTMANTVGAVLGSFAGGKILDSSGVPVFLVFVCCCAAAGAAVNLVFAENGEKQ